MDYLLRAEQRYRDHYDRVAAANRDGWRQARSKPRRYRLASARVSLARILVTLAARLAPADAPMPSIELAPERGG